MMPFYSFETIAMITFAIFFYRVGKAEDSPGLLWAAISVGISLIISYWFRGGLFAMLLGQIGLFIGIAIFRKEPKMD